MAVDPGLRFCPRCAGALSWQAAGDTAIAVEHPTCSRCGYVLWQNPKPSVEALIVRETPGGMEVLLGHVAGRGWDLPGNFLNASDRIEEALVRECRREMGVEVLVDGLLGAYEEHFFDARNQQGVAIISIVYVCRLLSGEPRAADIIDDVCWFPLSDPPAELAYPAVGRAIEAMQRRIGAR